MTDRRSIIACLDFQNSSNADTNPALLAKQSGGQERIDVLTLFTKMHTLWTMDPRVHKYINALEDSQRKLLRAALPISDNLLEAFATVSLLNERSFPNDCPTWERKPKHEQTWQKWKGAFLPLHRPLEQEKRARTRRTNTFRSAASTLETHMINPSRVQ